MTTQTEFEVLDTGATEKKPGTPEIDFSNLTRTPLQPHYPLSSSQRRLWILSQFEAANVAYNMPSAYVFEGALNREALFYAFSALVARHESLRTVFRQDEDGNIRQFIKAPAESGTAVKYHDLSGDPDAPAKLRHLVHVEVTAPFDLDNGPLIRAALYRIEDAKWVFAGTMHHIVSDGWSMEVLIYELLLFYHAHLRKVKYILPPLKFQYKDYAVWQQQQLQHGILQQQKQYWAAQMGGPLPVLELQGDWPRPVMKTYNGDSIGRELTAEFSKAITAVCHQEGSTLFMGMLAAVNTLLYRHTGQEDIIIGSPIAGREHLELEGQIGFYVNTMVMRSRFSGSASFRTLLRQTRDTTLAAYENQSFPFDELLDLLQIRHDPGRNPIFDVMVVMQNADGGRRKKAKAIEGLTVTQYFEERANKISKFDLLFSFGEQGEHIQFAIEYNTDIYSRNTIDRMAHQLQQIWHAVVANPDIPLDDIALLTPDEALQLQVLVNGAEETGWPLDATIQSLFEAQVEKTPDLIAVVFDGLQLTYRQLNIQANQLAYHLRQTYQLQPDDRVAIRAARSPNMIIAMLGILKAGGAYVPVDPEYPADRIAFMISDSGAKLVLDDTTIQQVINVAQDRNAENLPAIHGPQHLAYVIYTSGTTGIPKGTLIEHRQVVRLLKTDKPMFDFRNNDVWSVFHSFCFDVSVWEMYGTLFFGGKMVIVSTAVARDPQLFSELLMREKVTILCQTPSAFYNLMKYEVEIARQQLQIRYVIFAGEALAPARLRDWHQFNPGARLINMYGITETTVHVTFKEITGVEIASGVSNIGKPLPTLTCYVLDKNQRMVPLGVPGELYVGGDGVARGYLNREELTQQRFLQSPFKQGERLYRSGDRVRVLDNGEMEYSGRFDDQVKIRGYRIETGEIEAALMKYGGIESAIVIPKSLTGTEKELVAYIVCNAALNAIEVRTYLSGMLPAYMVPGYYVQLDTLPLTSNGKINKKLLPDPAETAMSSGAEYLAPRTENETRMAVLWQEVLGKEKISVLDNFFNLGGHSLNATRLTAKIFRAFDVKISLNAIFAYPVLEDMVRLVEQSAGTAYLAIDPAPAADGYPLSLSQGRLWVLSQFEQANAAYNMPGVYLLEGVLNTTALQQACIALLRRHESLRTRFKEGPDGQVLQYIFTAESLEFSVLVQDLRGTGNPEAEARNLLGALFSRPFDLATEPLLRVGVYRLDDSEWVLGYVMHHIVSDGWSMNIVIREMLELYNACQKNIPVTLQPLRIQYKDFAWWQHQQFSGTAMNEHQQYWMAQLSGELPVLGLTTDYTRPAVQTFNGAVAQGILGAEASKKLYQLCREHGATLFMGLLAGVNALLYRYTRQDDIIVGTVVAGREHADLDNQIGFYINTLPLRTRFSGTGSFTDLLTTAKQVAFDAFAHQLYPFDKLVEDLHLRRDMSRSPVFDVMVVLQNAGMEELGQVMEGMQVKPFTGVDNPVSKFDLTFNFMEAGDEVLIGIEFNTDIFSAETANQMVRHLRQLIRAVVNAPGTPLQDIEYLTEAEKHRLLFEYNQSVLPFDETKTAIEYIEEQVARTPAATALEYKSLSWTYRAVNHKANQLAEWLRQRHLARPGYLVAIKMERTEKLIIATIGVLKSGAAFLPVDPGYPEDRIQYMLADSKAALVLDDNLYCEFEAAADNYSGGNLVNISEPQDTAYIIYTSGSTGKPKGVVVQHRNLTALTVQCLSAYCPFAVTMPYISSSSFDISLFELLIPLTSGGAVQMLDNEMLKDMKYVAETVKRANGLFCTPSMLAELVEQIKSDGTQPDYDGLLDVYTGGDTVPSHLLVSLREIFVNARLNNLYGPTEATIYVTEQRYATDADPAAFNGLLLGFPISNASIYILDPAGKPVPHGVCGEMYAGGARIAAGYLNRPELTAEKFIPDPWVPGGRLYRTGDAGRWLHDGGIEFMGRVDNQVKIRGYRIEPGEIESVLESHEDIDAAVVIPYTNPEHEKVLAAYIKTRNEMNVSGLRSFLSTLLPEYMVPGLYVQVQEFPLTPNGKINKKALPKPEENSLKTGAAYVAPGNETEEKLLVIWKEFLSREQIGIHDNFFDLGGSSMTLVKMVRRISTEFNRNVGVVTLFQYTNISSLAGYLMSGAGVQDAAAAGDIQEGVNIMDQTLNLLN